MVQRWVSRHNEEIKEFRSAVAIAKYYGCSMPTLYIRLKKNNQNGKSPVFGKDIKIYRISGTFGDEIDPSEIGLENNIESSKMNQDVIESPKLKL